MNHGSTPGAFAAAPAPAENAWLTAFSLFSGKLRRHLWSVILCALVGGGLGLIVKSFLPRTYYASAQLLFDPQGLKVFNNAIKTGYYDANAAINYVESQMVVIRSERVLSRVIEVECASIANLPGDASSQSVRAVRHGFSKLCPGSGPDGSWAKALQALERSINVYRLGRSFVVNVQASGPTPEAAARLAAATVAAFKHEDAATRSATARQLTSDLEARLQLLRRNLIESEAKAEEYAQAKNLLRVDGKLVVEQRLAVATIALNETRRRLEQADLRLRLLKSGLHSPGGAGNTNTTSATRQDLIVRSQLRDQIAVLSKRAGRRHPELVALRAKLSRLSRSTEGQSGSARRAAQREYNSASAEYENQAGIVKKLTAQFAEADRAGIELRAIKQQVDANRRLVEQFESRAREAAEFGRIDAGNLRVVSEARIPPKGRAWPRLVLSAMIGVIFGIMIGVSGILLATFRSMGAVRKLEPDISDADDIDNLRTIAAEMRRRDVRPATVVGPRGGQRPRIQRRYG